MAEATGQMAEATGQADTVDGAKCPFARVSTLQDVSRLLRSKTAVTHSPDLFASRASDEVNGEINVREFLAASMMYTEGDSHRLRRKLLNPLVRADALQGIREDVVLPEADRLMALWLAEPDADGVYRLDLIEFLERIFIHFTARLIGLIDMETDERLALMRSFAGPLAAGTSSGFLADRDAVNSKGAGGQAALRRGVLHPVAALAPGDAGQDRRRADRRRGGAVQPAQAGRGGRRAGVGGRVQRDRRVDPAVRGVGRHQHPVDRAHDRLPAGLVRRAPRGPAARRATRPSCCTACRRRSGCGRRSRPYTTRLSLEQNQLADGSTIYPGQELHMEWVKANRDTEVFGPDAVGFNPNRATPADGTPRYGLGFGLGVHQCYGLRVVVGNDGSGGAHVMLLKKLMDAGVRPDPDQPAGRPGEGHGQVRRRGHPPVHQVPGHLRRGTAMTAAADSSSRRSQDMAALRGQRYLIVSSDSHAGPNPEKYLRPYCPEQFLPEFDDFCAQSRATADRMIDHVNAGRAGGKADPTLRELGLEGTAECIECSGHYDPEVRLRHMDESGVAAEVVFAGGQNFEELPFMGKGWNAGLAGVRTELRSSAQVIWNRWLAEFITASPTRLMGVLQNPVWDIDLAVAEIEWGAARGLRVVNLPAPRRDFPAYTDRAYDKLWAACVDNGCVLTTHSGGGEEPLGRRASGGGTSCTSPRTTGSATAASPS